MVDDGGDGSDKSMAATAQLVLPLHGEDEGVGGGGCVLKQLASHVGDEQEYNDEYQVGLGWNASQQRLCQQD